MFAKSEEKIALMTKEVKKMYEDVGMSWGLEKCAAVHVKRGKIIQTDDLLIGEDSKIRVLHEDDKYKFLGKYESFEQLDKYVFKEASEEYCKRLGIIWSSPLSVPRKVTSTTVFALPVLEYHMGTSEWEVAEIQALDRKSRSIIAEYKGKHISKSLPLMYLPKTVGGRGFKSVEDTHRMTKIKVAHHINVSTDPRMKLIRSFQDYKMKRNHRSIIAQAIRTCKDHFELEMRSEEGKTVLTENEKSMEFCENDANAIKRRLENSLKRVYQERVRSQKWLGHFATLISDSKDLSPNSQAINHKWKNIPDIVLSTNIAIKQQLLPTKAYEKYKLQEQVPTTTCRLCHNAEETVKHLMSSCSAIAQSLYKARHDKMLRPTYHFLLSKYKFNQSDYSKPWYKQSIPVTSIENQHAKILWDVPLVLERRPTNNAIKPDMILFDKDAKKIILIEGTVCAPDIILTREDEKQQKYGEMRKSLEKMYPEYNVDQINVVFDFLACYSKQFYTKMEKLIENSKQ